MKIMDDGTTLLFRFSPFKTLSLNRNSRTITLGKTEIPFDEVKGFWKNYRISGKKKVYFVVLLTKNKMLHITPDMDEYDVDEVIGYLIDILGEDKYAR